MPIYKFVGDSDNLSKVARLLFVGGVSFKYDAEESAIVTESILQFWAEGLLARSVQEETGNRVIMRRKEGKRIWQTVF